MENANHQEVSRWVQARAAELDPPAGWKPDADLAAMRFHAKLAETSRRGARQARLSWVLAAAATAAAVIVAAPGARVLAQQVWQMLTVKRVGFIRVNSWPEGVPSPAVKLMGAPVPPLPARDAADAAWRVHYGPRLPRPGVLSGSPQLLTTFALAAGTVVHVADLRLALAKAGVAGLTVPDQWDGAQLALHTSGIVIAQWPDVVLVQSLPLTLTAPANFDFNAFSTVIFGILGVGPSQAQQLAQQMGTVPPWLAPVGEGLRQNFAMEQIALNSGPATLVTDVASDAGASPQITILWSAPDRVYALQGKLSRDLMIATANAVE
jgi:hypothetical protein